MLRLWRVLPIKAARRHRSVERFQSTCEMLEPPRPHPLRRPIRPKKQVVLELRIVKVPPLLLSSPQPPVDDGEDGIGRERWLISVRIMIESEDDWLEPRRRLIQVRALHTHEHVNPAHHLQFIGAPIGAHEVAQRLEDLLERLVQPTSVGVADNERGVLEDRSDLGAKRGVGCAACRVAVHQAKHLLPSRPRKELRRPPPRDTPASSPELQRTVSAATLSVHITQYTCAMIMMSTGLQGIRLPQPNVWARTAGCAHSKSSELK